MDWGYDGGYHSDDYEDAYSVMNRRRTTTSYSVSTYPADSTITKAPAEQKTTGGTVQKLAAWWRGGSARFIVERAKSGRAKCRCDICPHMSKIAKDELRVGVMTKSARHPGCDTAWYHASCMAITFNSLSNANVRITKSRQLSGWDNLSDEDKDRVEDMLIKNWASASNQITKAVEAQRARVRAGEGTAEEMAADAARRRKRPLVVKDGAKDELIITGLGCIDIKDEVLKPLHARYDAQKKAWSIRGSQLPIRLTLQRVRDAFDAYQNDGVFPQQLLADAGVSSRGGLVPLSGIEPELTQLTQIGTQYVPHDDQNSQSMPLMSQELSQQLDRVPTTPAVMHEASNPTPLKAPPVTNPVKRINGKDVHTNITNNGNTIMVFGPGTFEIRYDMFKAGALWSKADKAWKADGAEAVKAVVAAVNAKAH